MKEGREREKGKTQPREEGEGTVGSGEMAPGRQLWGEGVGSRVGGKSPPPGIAPWLWH